MSLRNLGFVLLFVAGFAHADAAPFDLSDAEHIKAGHKRFNKTCAAYCHGFQGSGGRAPALNAPDGLPPEQMFTVITEGRRGAEVMPPWGTSFTPEQIWELIAYIQSLRSTAPAAP
jgi:mono/diheme cytochrome c family protein